MKINYKICILICIELIFIVFFITKSNEEDISYKLTSKIHTNMYSNTVNFQDELILKKVDNVHLKDNNGNDKVTFNRYIASDGKNTAYMYLLNGDGATFKTGSTIIKKSDKKYIYYNYILQNSYPNISLEAMGVANEEEAYIATKYALSYMATMMGQNSDLDETKDLYSFYEIAKRKHYSTSCFAAADRLISYSKLLIHDGVDFQPKLIKDVTSSNFSINGGRITIGPYKVHMENAIFANMEITINNIEGTEIAYTLLDKDGNVIRKVKEDEEFYIAYSYDPTHPKIIVNNKINAYTINGIMYEMESLEGRNLKFLVPTKEYTFVEYSKDYTINMGDGVYE